VDFVAPSKLGEMLSASLSLHRLGKSSIHLEILIQGPDASDRVRGKLVLVMTDLRTGHAQAIPGEFRESLSKYHLAVHTKEPDAHTEATSGQRSGERH
jgi:acyl-CoA thioesterase FadM